VSPGFGREIPLEELRPGTKIFFKEAAYWEEKVSAAGTIQGVVLDGDQIRLRMSLEGSQSETLVKWAGARPRQSLEAHLCGQDCGRLSKEELLHAKVGRPEVTNGWTTWGTRTRGVMGEEDELARVRERALMRDRQRGRELPLTPVEREERSRSDSA